MDQEQGITPEAHRWLTELAAIPTVAGKEHRVVRWVQEWLTDRPGLTMTPDAAGNLLILPENADPSPVLLTAHLDHPGFVVDEIAADGTLTLSFLGGVHGPYFDGARVVLYPADPDSTARPVRATITGRVEPDPPGRLYRSCTAQAEGPLEGFGAGDLAVWDLPEPSIEDGIFSARVCDDLAAAAAALVALDTLGKTEAKNGVGVLFTRAEEVGFIGAIAACKLGTIPRGSRLLALENSRSFPDSPPGGGPIVRVGDRLSTFSPTLNAGVARVAQSLTGIPEKNVGEAKVDPETSFRWQRKLMPGGACEATAYSAFGYEATCLCLPLINYHNMGDLAGYEDAVKRGEKPAATIEPERISLDDFDGLVRLLVACGTSLGSAEPLTDRLEKLYAERSSVLGPFQESQTP